MEDGIMKIIVVLSIIFAMYELLKLVFIKKYWKMGLDKRSPLVLTVEIIYMILLVIILFSKYWYVGLTILLLSIISAYNLAEAIRLKSALTNRSKLYIFADGVITILAFLILILNKIL
jgi:hypothetical protein